LLNKRILNWVIKHEDNVLDDFSVEMKTSSFNQRKGSN
jgi:hypothetical protein